MPMKSGPAGRARGRGVLFNAARTSSDSALAASPGGAWLFQAGKAKAFEVVAGVGVLLDRQLLGEPGQRDVPAAPGGALNKAADSSMGVPSEYLEVVIRKR